MCCASVLAGLASYDSQVERRSTRARDERAAPAGSHASRPLYRGASFIHATGNALNNVLTGNAAINATGNALNNILNGSNAANQLHGGLSADVLFGGGGNDVFCFSLGEASGDIVQDFRGNGAAAGDLLSFCGYGIGATFTHGSGDFWSINTARDCPKRSDSSGSPCSM
jgi:hypothetical protein